MRTISDRRSKINLETVGGRIQFRRISAGWSRAQLGAMMNLAPATISYHERGEYPMSAPLVERFADALGCNPTDLDPNHVETVRFRYTGNNTYMVTNAFDDTLKAYGIKRDSRFSTAGIGEIMSRLLRSGRRVEIEGIGK